MIKFSTRELMLFVTLLAVVIGLIRGFGVLGGLLASIFAVTLLYSLDRLLFDSRRDLRAFVGAGIGGAIGAALGPYAGLGHVALRLYPELPARDFEALFGAIAGSFAGALLGAILLSVSARIRMSAQGD